MFNRVCAELDARGEVVRQVVVPRSDAPARAGLNCCWRLFREIRTAKVVHVEFGSNDAEVFWFALLATFLSPTVVAVIHDHPKVVNHPGASLLRRRTRLGQAVAYRILIRSDRMLKDLLLRRACVVAAFSAEACVGFARRGARRVEELSHGADPASPTEPPSRGECILFAGFLGPSKGIDSLLEAWARYGHLAGLSLRIAGDGDLGPARDLLDSTRVPIQILGPIPSETEFQQLIERSAIVVLPYRYSSPASGILIRALAAGRAVLATPVPATRALQSGVDCVIVPIDDVDALGLELVRLSNDAEERDRLGAAALETAARLFTWNRHIESLLVAYRAAGWTDSAST